MKRPDEIDADKCLEIRKRSKRGWIISSEEMEFCRQMFREYPDWYVSINQIVFNETVPFGTQAKYSE